MKRRQRGGWIDQEPHHSLTEITCGSRLGCVHEPRVHQGSRHQKTLGDTYVATSSHVTTRLDHTPASCWLLHYNHHRQITLEGFSPVIALISWDMPSCPLAWNSILSYFVSLMTIITCFFKKLLIKETTLYNHWTS